MPAPSLQTHEQELATGQRFGFGDNWARFLEKLDDERILRAMESLVDLLKVPDLMGRSFVDVGSGSGLFSLAARRLGAHVVSFDFDPRSVACTLELRRRYFPDDPHWQVQEQSILDADLPDRLGRFDVVYSWGVLHHTGQMWKALSQAERLVNPGGLLAVALYNDQGLASKVWNVTKRVYNVLPVPLRFLVVWPSLLRLWGPTTLRDLVSGRPFQTWRSYASLRGMDPWRDLIDWVGGYPFEVVGREPLIEFYTRQGYELVTLRSVGSGLGCNEFAFRRAPQSPGESDGFGSGAQASKI